MNESNKSKIISSKLLRSLNDDKTIKLYTIKKGIKYNRVIEDINSKWTVPKESVIINNKRHRRKLLSKLKDPLEW